MLDEEAEGHCNVNDAFQLWFCTVLIGYQQYRDFWSRAASQSPVLLAGVWACFLVYSLLKEILLAINFSASLN
jgi:hypothetical protein